MTAIALVGLAVASFVVLWFALGSVLDNLYDVYIAWIDPPLSGLDLSGFAPSNVPPRRWPRYEEVEDAKTSAAYAAVAEDRLVVVLLFADTATVAGGALLGVNLVPFEFFLPGSLRWIGCLAIIIGGVGARRTAQVYWEPIVAAYRARAAALTAPTSPPASPLPPRATLLRRMLRR